MKQFLERGTLQQAERIFADRVSELPQLPPLGPQFMELGGRDLRDALIVHRIVSQFSLAPSVEDTRQLEAAGFREMLDYDASFVPTSWRTLGPDDRRVFIGAQEFLRSMLKSFKKTYRVKFPRNETHVSAKGDTSLYAKLAHLDQWTVSADAIDYSHRIVWNNRALRKMVKSHFREKFAGTWRTVLAKWKAELPEDLSDGSIGFAIIGKMFRSLVTIVGTSRLSSVPKNNRARRVITLEPLWNMICQLSYSLDLRDCFTKFTGFSLSWLQTWHKSRIASGDATIDFSNASNSNWWQKVVELWPRRITSDLAKLRTGIAEHKGEYFPLQMMAPMGCGFTFEVMTLTLLAYSRQFCKRATVFGDDVIMSPEGAEGFISFVTKVGWKINESKSFICGNFRESCGAFYDLAAREYLVSYDFPPFEDHIDIVVTMNKLRDLFISSGASESLKEWMVVTWVALAKLVPAELFSHPAVNLQGSTVDFVPQMTSRRCRRTPVPVQKQQTLQLNRRVSLQHVRLVKPPVSIRQDDGAVGVNASIAASLFEMGCAERTQKSERIQYEWCDELGSNHHGMCLFGVEHDRDRPSTG